MTTLEIAQIAELKTAAVILASDFIDRMGIHDPAMKLEISLSNYALKYHHNWSSFKVGTEDRKTAERVCAMMWLAENF